MEGDRVLSRTWSLILQRMPAPVRWVGWEFVRLVHSVDHGAGQLIVGLRTSPAWYFVTIVGSIGVGLTILLFISVIEQTSAHHQKSKVSSRTVAQLGRDHLEKIHDWSAQDRWRIAHFFVPHKPAERPKDILIDSRSTGFDGRAGQLNSRRVPSYSTGSSRDRHEKDLEVRLDVSRPKNAQQGKRLVAETIVDSGSQNGLRPELRMRFRNPRLLVQASWEFGSECYRDDYVSRPIRRPIPVPVPEPEFPIPFAPRHRDTPDLSFEMAFIRHFTTSGLFPHGSHIVHVSDCSVFPVDDPRYQNTLVSHGDRRWQSSDLARHHNGEHHASDVEFYEGTGVYERISAEHQTSDEFDQALQSFADVGLRVELMVPRSVAEGRPSESKLIIRNEGDDAIPRIEVQDLISQLHTVVAAEPEGMIETTIIPETGSSERLLHREVRGLAPGDGQEFALKWIPEGGRRHIHRTRVIAHAAVSTVTDINPPDPDQQMRSIPPEVPPEKHYSLACDFKYLERVYVGDDFDLEVTIRNTGDSALHDVQVRIELPAELSHRDGNSLVIDAGNLQVHGRNQKVLTVSAKQAGDAVNMVQVASAERIEAHGRANILVVERKNEPAALPPIPDTIRPKPQTVTPRIAQPTGNCCCQRLPVTQIEPSLRLP